jgi:hypothetical protein
LGALLHVLVPLLEENLLGMGRADLDGCLLSAEGVDFLLQSLDLGDFLVIGMVELVVILLNRGRSTQKM